MDRHKNGILFEKQFDNTEVLFYLSSHKCIRKISEHGTLGENVIFFMLHH